MRNVLFLVAAIISATTCCAEAANGQAKPPLPIEAIMRMKSVMSYDVSPDHKYLAVVIGDHKPGYSGNPGTTGFAVEAHLAIVDLSSGVITAVASGDGRVQEPTWSPDGKQLAFVTSSEKRAEIWVWSVADGARTISSSVTPQWSASETLRLAWSPDSSAVLVPVVSEGDDYRELIAKSLKSPDTGSKAYPIDPLEPGADVAVYKSGGALVGSTATGGNPTRENPICDGSCIYNESDLALVDVTSGATFRVAKHVHPIFIRVSGRNAAFGDLKGFTDRSGAGVVDLGVVDLTARTVRTAVRGIQLGNLLTMDVSWSPDGKHLAFCELFQPKDAKGSGCFRVDAATDAVVGSRGPLAPNEPIRASFLRAPKWDESGRFFYAIERRGTQLRAMAAGEELEIVDAETLRSREIELPQDRPARMVSKENVGIATRLGENELLLHYRDLATKDAGFIALNTSTGALTTLYRDAVSLGEDIVGDDIITVGDRAIFLKGKVDVPSELWTSDLSFRNARQLTHLNDDILTYGLGKSRLVSWHAPSGRELHGALLLPAGYETGRLYPLVVEIYSGPQSNALNYFGLNSSPPAVTSVWQNLQLLASRGYAVFLADTEKSPGTPMKDEEESLMPGINKLIEQGVVDPERMGLVGQSYGGYAVLSVVVQTHRFKAAVVENGPSSLPAVYAYLYPDGTAPYADEWLGTEEKLGQGGMVGTVWQRRDDYIENSPFYYLDRVTTPILAIYGNLDPAVPPLQGDEIFVGLRALGKEVEYAKYLNESHGVVGWSNSIDLEKRVIDWFDEHLKR